MRLKHVLLIAMILAMLTIGAVSASDYSEQQNQQASVELIQDGNLTDSCSVECEKSNPDTLDSIHEEVLGESGDIECDIKDEATFGEDYWNEVFISFKSHNSSVTGDLKVYVDGAVKYDSNITSDSYLNHHLSFDICCDEIYMDEGSHDVKVTLNGQTLKQKTVKSMYEFSITAYPIRNDDDSQSREYVSGDYIDFYVNFPSDARGKLKFTFNGRKYDLDLKQSNSVLVPTDGLGLGEYKAVVQFTPNSNNPSKYRDYLANKTEKSIWIIPKIVSPGYDGMSAGEKQYIEIYCPSKDKGTVFLRGRYYNGSGSLSNDSIDANISIVNGYGEYSLSKLKPGGYLFTLSMSIGSLEYDCEEYIEIQENSPEFKSSVSPKNIIVGKKVTLKVSGPKINHPAYIYLDNKEIKSISLKKGKISYTFSNLKAGKHKIRVWFYYGDFYSKTYYVTVKKVSKLTALKKTFKAKQKTKKYTVTLKSGKNAIKKVRLTLKIKGKTYKATTNSKGKATFKINNLTKKGKYTALVQFKGNTYYTKSSKKVRITVEK